MANQTMEEAIETLEEIQQVSGIRLEKLNEAVGALIRDNFRLQLEREELLREVKELADIASMENMPRAVKDAAQRLIRIITGLKSEESCSNLAPQISTATAPAPAEKRRD